MKKMCRLLALLLTLAMVLPMALPVLPVGAAAVQTESVIFEDSFDYTTFAYEDFYGTGIWKTETSDCGSGLSGALQPVVEDGVMKLSKKMSAQFDWLNIPGFSFDSTKTYTLQFDVTVKDFGNDTDFWDTTGNADMRRELYVAPGGWYNQVELRSDNGSKCIRTGGNYTGSKDVEYLLDTRYTVVLVWEPSNQKITSTLKNGDTVVSTGYRTGSGYANADAHCAHWILRCEDGAIEVDNFSWTDGTNTYTEDFSYAPADQSMDAAGYWEKEITSGFTNCTAPELVDGVVKMDTKDSIQFNWTKLVEYDVENAYIFEFDFKVTNPGSGYIWNGTSSCTRALYVAPGGYYNQIEVINATPKIRAGNTYVDYDENVYLNKDLHAKLVLEGTTITSTIYDENGNVLVTGSRTSSDYADMTVRNGAMTYLTLRCEDGAVELDNFSLSTKEVAKGISTDLQIGEGQRAVYSCQLQYVAGDAPKVKLNETQVFTLSNGDMTICGNQVAGSYPEGIYGVSVDVNPVQRMVSVEITLPDGGIVRRGLYSIISGTESAYAVEVLTQDDAYVTDIAVQQHDVTENDYTLVTTEPAYEGFNANVYNLVTAFSDPCTTRSFAWTALASYIGNDAMAIRYRANGTEEWTVVDAIKEIEGVETASEEYFKADIEGLTADTQYEYQIGKKDSTEASDWSEIYSFKTVPENVNEFSFVAIGDSQGHNWSGTSDGSRGYMFTEAAIKEGIEATGDDAAFILHAGDVVQTGNVLEQWNLYLKTLGQYAANTPHFAAIGNHDVVKLSGDGTEFYFDLHFNHPNNGGTAALDTAYTSQITGGYLAALAQDADETIYSYNYGDAHFVVLNSGNYSGEDRLILEAQRAWLKADLEANASAKWTIVMVHEPVYHRVGGGESRPWLYDVIEGYGVDLVIQGHSHLVTRTYPMKDGAIVSKESPDVIKQGTGTVYTTIGSTTPSHDGLGNPNMENMLLIKTPATEQAAYTTVTVSDDQLVMTVKQLNGLVLDSFVIEAASASVNGESFTSAQEAVNAANGQMVTILNNTDEAITITADVTIDLAGHTLGNVTVTENATLTLIDTVTAGYQGQYGFATVTGAVKTFSEVDGKSYMTVGENGVYSAHCYDVAITHISLDASNDALGYKAKLYGDEVVQSHVQNFGFNLWLDGGQVKTYGKTGSDVLTLRLKNILSNNGGKMNINATAFATLAVGEKTITKICSQQTTTMKQTLQKVNAAWTSYTEAQKTAVKALCDQYYDTVSAWKLDNIYPTAAGESVALSFDAATGSISDMGGFAVKDGKLTVPNNGEGKAILTNTPTGNKTVSVELYPNTTINAGIYLGASGAASGQDKINGISVFLESYDTANPNRLDIVVGNFPAYKQLYRFVTEGSTALFTDGVKEPVTLTVVQNGNELTMTVALVSDPTKSATTTYTYAGDYDLSVGQVGMRSQYNDCAFDNFKVIGDQQTVEYTFDNEAATEGLAFYHSGWNGSINATADATLALHKDATFTDGTLSMEINTNGNNEAGIVFGADAEGKNYYLYRLTADRFVELVKVENGVETVLDRGYLSAGHINNSFNRMEVVKNGNQISCYYYNRFDKINCYAVYEDAQPLTGDHMGFWGKTSGAGVRNITIADSVQTRKADVLIFGHSYTEMWWDYETYFPEYDAIDDIGIGGSVASHWEDLADEVIAYQPKLGIYNIGINDLTNGTSPEAVIASIESALLTMKEALPEFEVVLVSVSHCPARSGITNAISQTNGLMCELAEKYDWMHYAEAEYLFCTDATNPLSTDANLFIDGLHPSAEGYQLMADVVRSAINGDN